MLNSIISNLQKANVECKKVAKISGKSALFHMADLLYSYARYGCLPRQYSNGDFYRRRGFDRAKIVTYRKTCKLINNYNQADCIPHLQNKIQFNKTFAAFINRQWLDIQYINTGGVKQFLSKHKSVIVKPLKGEEGHGIRKYTVPDDGSVDYEALLSEWKKEGVIVEEIVRPHPEMVFGNKSLNTIRTMTMLDTHGKAHLVKAILRAGIGENIVDNYCSGGVIYAVDVETGIVTTPGKSRIGDNVICHPGTDIVMLGYKIPCWEQVIKISEEAAESIPGCRFIGWDVAITDHSVELIEGNHNPDYELLEFIGDTCLWPKIKQYI